MEITGVCNGRLIHLEVNSLSYEMTRREYLRYMCIKQAKHIWVCHVSANIELNIFFFVLLLSYTLE
jgi:hypothetical protein